LDEQTSKDDWGSENWGDKRLQLWKEWLRLCDQEYCAKQEPYLDYQ
jgi:hypothetical protein